MVFALYGLSAAMVAGGLWSVFQGLDFVVMERGWTMAIAGSVCATGGVLLFGLARGIVAIQSLEAALQRGAARAALPDAPPPRPNMSGLAGILPDPPMGFGGQASAPAPSLGAPALGAAGLGAAAVAGALGVSEAGAEPARPVPPPPPADPLLADAPAAPPRPDPLLADAPTPFPPPRAVEEPGPAPDEFGFAGLLRGTQGDAPGPARADDEHARNEPEAPRTAVHFDEPVVPAADEPRTAVHFEEPVVAEEPPPVEDDAPAEELVVIGTYGSGGNNYIMYSDGSIEAETPTGRFHFASLEELKEFIAAGGEAPADAGRA